MHKLHFLKNQFKVENKDNFIFYSFLLKELTDTKKAEQTSNSVQGGSWMPSKGKESSLTPVGNPKAQWNTFLYPPSFASFALSSCLSKWWEILAWLPPSRCVTQSKKTRHRTPPCFPKRAGEAGRNKEPEKQGLLHALYPHCRQRNFQRKEEGSHGEASSLGLHRQERFFWKRFQT